LGQVDWKIANEHTRVLVPSLKSILEVLIKLNHFLDDQLTNNIEYKNNLNALYSREWVWEYN